MTISSVSSASIATVQSDGMRSFSSPPPSVAVASSAVAATATTAAQNVSTQAPSPEHVAQAVQQVNDAFNQRGQDLYASIERDKDTGIHVVKVLDKKTNEVISQFPSKEIIAIAESISAEQEDRGQLLNVKA
jgi:flagellar protein FlaG